MKNITYDVVVIGSGGGAFLAAIRAASKGARVIMLEKSNKMGGTSAKSGGGIWIPNNKKSKKQGIHDSFQDAFNYMRAVIPKDQVDDDTIKNYIDNAPKMLEFLESNTLINYNPIDGYADYYPGTIGWKNGGRTMSPSYINGKLLGDMMYKIVESPSASKALGIFSMNIADGIKILAATPGWQKTMLEIVFKYLTDFKGRFKGKRDRQLAQGNALIGGLYLASQKFNVDLKLESPVTDLLTENNRVIGVKAIINSEKKIINAKKGVIIASGGFENNDELRKKYLPSPTSALWSAGVKTNTGDLLKMGQKIGAATDLLHEAWWAPIVKTPNGPTVLFSEKSKPGLIIVDKNGRRFMNESITYNSYGDCFYNAVENGHDCFPAFVIFDKNYRKNYVFAGMPQSSLSPDWLNISFFKKGGTLKKDKSLEKLANRLGIDYEGLSQTIDKMNLFAENGKDSDFDRGGDEHDKMYGDIRVQPNPCLGKFGKSPFYGTEIYPGDIGTKGGFRINNYGQVLNESGSSISGLYATGNCTASIMGDKYPGAGCTLGPALVIGYIAGQHILE